MPSTDSPEQEALYLPHHGHIHAGMVGQQAGEQVADLQRQAARTHTAKQRLSALARSPTINHSGQAARSQKPTSRRVPAAGRACTACSPSRHHLLASLPSAQTPRSSERQVASR